MPVFKIYIFAGKFDSTEEARRYSEPQWEPEPDDSISTAEYEEWEDRNPSLQLTQNVDAYLDNDFIETISICFQYLSDIKMCDADIQKVKQCIQGENVFVLVYEQAFDCSGLKSDPISNSFLRYCGQYQCEL